MKLTRTDIGILTKWGFPLTDIPQIEAACSKTVYTMGNKRIPRKRALEVLGREVYLSGIARSAFHYSSVREGINGETVYFNSSKLFE